jgi:hypothetical protein
MSKFTSNSEMDVIEESLVDNEEEKNQSRINIIPPNILPTDNWLRGVISIQIPEYTKVSGINCELSINEK